jgi:predicted negative regulator of RcsB-dependent stress response
MNTENIAKFFADNWVVIAGAVAIVVVGALGFGIWQDRQSSFERKASEALYEAQLQARDSLAAKNISEAEKKFAPVFEKFGKSRAAFEASLLLGDLYMDAGNFPEAEKRYEAALVLAKDAFSKLLAQYNLGIAKESAGNFQAAVASYDQALSTSSDFLRPEILMAKARCLEALQKVTEAVQVYQEVQKKFPNRSFYSGAAAAFEKKLSSGTL